MCKDKPPRNVLPLLTLFLSPTSVCLPSCEEIFPQHLILRYKQPHQASETSIFCKEVLDDCAAKITRFK